jgi:hypothetical protein
MWHSDLVVVQAFGTEVEADLAKSMLESAGIDAMIQADRAGGMRDHLAWSGFGFKVLVREEDAATAHDVLKTPRDSKPVVVHTFGTHAEAETATGVLFSSGIDATITWTGSEFQVLVHEEEAAIARDVLNPPNKVPE